MPINADVTDEPGAEIVMMPPIPETVRRVYESHCRYHGTHEGMFAHKRDPRLLEIRDLHNRNWHASGGTTPRFTVDKDDRAVVDSQTGKRAGFLTTRVAIRQATLLNSGATDADTYLWDDPEPSRTGSDDA